MQIQSLGHGKLVIYMEGDELRELPAAPHDMTTDDASDILRLALGQTFDEDWESVYFELFPGKDSLLLFALQHTGSPSFFRFSSVEPLISAAKSSPPGLISYLTCKDDTYVLVVYPWDCERPPAVLSEYSEELDRPAPYSLHLSEHGTVLAGPDALDVIRSVF